MYPSRRITRTCIGCNSAFSVPASRLKYGPALWCSATCRYSNPDWAKALYPDQRVAITCETCGKSFSTNRSAVKRKRFCSKRCLGVANGKRIIAARKLPTVSKTCLECGKCIEVRRCVSARAKFCSRACNAVWYGRKRRILRPTSIETALQSALRAIGIEEFTTEHKLRWYSIDIAFETLKVAVECDGTYWHSTPKQQAADTRKDALLKSKGWTVLRFTEVEINADSHACALRVADAVRKTKSPPSDSFSESEGGRSNGTARKY